MIACAMCTQMALYSMQFCLWESTICQSNTIAKEANNFTNLERVLIIFETDLKVEISVSIIIQLFEQQLMFIWSRL